MERDDRFHLDISGLAGQPEPEESLRTGDHYPGLHYDNLFDEDEDRAGELANQATGEPYDNSTYTGIEDLTEITLADEADLRAALDERTEEELLRIAQECGYKTVEEFLSDPAYDIPE